MSPAVARPARPVRPVCRPPPALPSFEALDRTHAELRQVFRQFDQLLQHMDGNGADAVGQANARAIHAFFAGHVRQHHADEEQFVFPPLLDGGDAELTQHVHRLQQDHGWLEEDWLELAPQIEAIAQGYNWYDLSTLRQTLPVFTALYAEHIALEESLIYPEARRRHQQHADRATARSD